MQGRKKMAMLADLLKEILGAKLGKSNPELNWPPASDRLMSRPPMEGEDAGKVISPDQYMHNKKIGEDPGNVYNEKGDIVDYLVKKMKGERDGGTIIGFINNLLNPKPNAEQKGQMAKEGRVGGDPNRVPGTGVDPALDPTPTAKQRVRGLQPIDRGADLEPPLPKGTPTPVPVDQYKAPPPAASPYEQPTAINPQQIEELRMSLLTQAGQMDPQNPNGLAGRMSGPYSKVDQQAQMGEAEDISNKVRGDYNSVDTQSPREPTNLQDVLKNQLLGGR
jgi:hypothetical protein